MPTGYLLVSGTPGDLEQFKADFVENKRFQAYLGLTELSPKAWTANPPVWFGERGRLERGVFPMPATAPVLTPTPERGYFPDGGPADTSQQSYGVAVATRAPEQPVAPAPTVTGQATANKLIAALQAVLKMLLKLLRQWLARWLSRPDDQGDTQDDPAALFNPCADGKPPRDATDQPRTYLQYQITTRKDVPVEKVLFELNEAVERANTRCKRYPSLAIEKDTRLRFTPWGPQPDDVPVDTLPIPDPHLHAPDYAAEAFDYFERIGLRLQNGSGSVQIAAGSEAQLYGQPLYKVHDIARGKGSVIVVIDTAPRFEEVPAADRATMFGNLDMLIDLQPEIYTEATRPKSAGSVQPSHKFHGLMIANLCKLVAPDARVILVRALDDFGFGHTNLIIQFTSFFMKNYVALGQQFNQSGWLNQNSRLVVNFSLVLAGTTREDIDAPGFLHALEFASSQFDPNKQAVLVCAAGNSSLPGQARNPMEPAAYGYFPGYSLDYPLVDPDQVGPTLPEPAPADSLLGDDPYNLLIGVAASSKNAPYFYASYSHVSPVAAPATEIILDPGHAMFLPVTQAGANGKESAEANTDGAKQPLSQKVSSRYVRWSGTSFAAPLVTAQAALLLGDRENPQDSPTPAKLVKQTIWQTAHQPQWWNRPREINIEASLQPQPVV